MQPDPEYHRYALSLAKSESAANGESPPMGAFPTPNCTVCDRCIEYVFERQTAHGAAIGPRAQRRDRALIRLRETVKIYERHGVKCEPPRDGPENELRSAGLMDPLPD